MSAWRVHRADSTLWVDITEGIESQDWERLLETIAHEIDATDAVVIVASPAFFNTLTTELLIEALTKNLERRGLEVRIKRSAW
jgi:hypothetical protein